jgi:mannosyltransferase
MNKPKQKEILILLLCLLIGFALRFYNFDQKSLWVDEIHTFNQSRTVFKDQLKSYMDSPTFLYPPLFFLLSHQFYPFTKPERDLRIIPLIFGILSIPMIYLLSRLFSPSIALSCTLSLTFMAYQISLSQEGRSYSMILFLGMAGLYFFIKYLKTPERKYLFLASLFFTVLIFTSYTSFPYIVFSQLLWFYRFGEEGKKPDLYSFLIFNGLILILCSPWFIFLILNYHSQSAMNPLEPKYAISFLNMLYGVFHDWTPHAPLMIISITLLILLPLFSKDRTNAIILLFVFILPIGSLYLFCILFNITHFISSKYFINFLPFLFISLYMSLGAIENKFEKFKNFIRLKPIFTILFIASNLLILPLYYQSGKQDFRGLVTYLKANLQDGDKIYLGGVFLFPGVLHYFGIYPVDRQYRIPFYNVSEREIEFRISLFDQNKKFTIFYCDQCIQKYMAERGRLWIVLGGKGWTEMGKNSPFILKGYFDGSFCNFDRFPTDASIYLFLWDPKSPGEKGIEMPIE